MQANMLTESISPVHKPPGSAACPPHLHVHISAGENVAEIFPAQMLHQMIVIQHCIRKSISLRRHEKRGSPVMAPQEISVSFLQGKQPVTRRPELAAQVPIIQR